MREISSDECEFVSGAGFWSEVGAGIDWLLDHPFEAAGIFLDNFGSSTYTYEANGIRNIK